MDEVPNVSRVGHHRSDGVLGLGDDGAFVHPADAGRLADDVLQGVRLLQLAQVVVLESHGGTAASARQRTTTHGCMYVCISGGVSHLVFFSSSLFIVFEDVVSDVILWVNKQLLCLPLLLSALDPHHKQQHHACNDTHKVHHNHNKENRT